VVSQCWVLPLDIAGWRSLAARSTRGRRLGPRRWSRLMTTT
jgi:hypothetical protein